MSGVWWFLIGLVTGFTLAACAVLWLAAVNSDFEETERLR